VPTITPVGGGWWPLKRPDKFIWPREPEVVPPAGLVKPTLEDVPVGLTGEPTWLDGKPKAPAGQGPRVVPDGPTTIEPWIAPDEAEPVFASEEVVLRSFAIVGAPSNIRAGGAARVAFRTVSRYHGSGRLSRRAAKY